MPELVKKEPILAFFCVWVYISTIEHIKCLKRIKFDLVGHFRIELTPYFSWQIFWFRGKIRGKIFI